MKEKIVLRNHALKEYTFSVIYLINVSSFLFYEVFIYYLLTGLFIYLFIPDLNECLLGVHSCSHSCHNTPGSYECSCDDGYQLSTDKRHCLGTFLTLLLS